MGVIDNSYYYPSAEEIRVGLECEINWNLGYETAYIPTILTLTKDGKNECCGEQSHDVDQVLEYCIWDRCSEVRVPLLDCEQIRSAGWRHDGESVEINTNKPCSLYSWGYWGYTLVTYPDSRDIRIYKEFKTPKLSDPLYNGPCPTINHLRDIMRLLNIKKEENGSENIKS